MSEFTNGINFECRKCGKCCINTDGTKGVHLYKTDWEKISSFLNLDINNFYNKYCKAVQDTFVFTDCTIIIPRIELKKRNTGECIFLNNGLCDVYLNRPILCEYGPFISGYMFSKEHLAEFTSTCIGMDKSSKLIDADKIQNMLDLEDILEDEWEQDMGKDPASSFLQKDPEIREIRYDYSYTEYVD